MKVTVGRIYYYGMYMGLYLIEGSSATYTVVLVPHIQTGGVLRAKYSGTYRSCNEGMLFIPHSTFHIHHIVFLS